MILSMTGFAAVAAELPGVSLSVELRSVNHRYLDLSLRLPDELRGLETALRERIAGALEARQGRVPDRAQPHRRRARRRWRSMPRGSASWPTAAAEVTRARPGRRAASVDEILRWPGVLAEPTVAAGPSSPRDAARCVEQALAELAASRAREGAKLAAMLEACCAAIEAQVARVAPRIPAIHAAYSKSWRAAARSRARPRRGPAEAGARAVRDQGRRRRGARAARRTHVAEVRRVLAQGGSAGKRLDFLDAGAAPRGEHAGLEIGRRRASQASLELKVLIEQMREQVQNIE